MAIPVPEHKPILNNDLRKITDSAQDIVKSVFTSKEVAFSFVAGSVAKFLGRQNSDIDLVVCLSSPVEDQTLEDFTSEYMRLHELYGFNPDTDYPGEVFCIDSLRSAIDKTRSTPPASEVTDETVYDGVVWSGMLSSEKIPLLVTDPVSLRKFIHSGREVVALYHKSIEHTCTTTEPSRPDLCLKRVITYTAHETQ